jgi:hypothetical protein
MPSWFGSRGSRVALGAAGALAVAVGVWFAFFRTRPDDTPPPPFRDVAEEAGLTWQMRFLPNEQGETFRINLYDHGCGLAVGDFDGDGHEDIYFCNQLGPNALYRNNGDGTFKDVAKEAGVALGDRICVGATFADYDNSGRQSLFVTSTRGGNVLFKNLGDGTFKDVTKEAGLDHIGHSQTGVFFDFDNDGYLDLYLTNTAEWTSDTFDKQSRYWVGKGDFGGVIHSKKEYNVLYHNVPVDPNDPSRGRKFIDVTEKAGLKGLGWAGDAVPFDFDGDGKIDLFVTNMFGRCQLYRNNGDGTFTDVTMKVLGPTPWGALGARAFDATNSGRLDLYVVDMHSDMWMGADFDHKSYAMALEYEKTRFPNRYGPLALRDPRLVEREKSLGQEIGFKSEEVVFGNAFYRNDGDGKFTERSGKADLETFWPWGIAVGDFNNDGYEDVFLPSGMGYPFYYWPNYLMMNQGNGTFRNRATEMGVEPPRHGKFLPQRINGRQAVRSSRCAVTGDFRGAGQLDIVVNNFNDRPYYFKNQLPRKNYVQFRLRGAGAPRSNRDAIGAVVRLYRGKQVMTRQVPSACGYLSHSSRTLHFGLGDQKEIDRVEITWPSGARQTISNPAVNRRHDIDEPKE